MGNRIIEHIKDWCRKRNDREYEKMRKRFEDEAEDEVNVTYYENEVWISVYGIPTLPCYQYDDENKKSVIKQIRKNYVNIKLKEYAKEKH